MKPVENSNYYAKWNAYHLFNVDAFPFLVKKYDVLRHLSPINQDYAQLNPGISAWALRNSPIWSDYDDYRFQFYDNNLLNIAQNQLYNGIYELTSDDPNGPCQDSNKVYVAMMAMNTNIIHAANPDIMVMNGGSGEYCAASFSDPSFFDLNGPAKNRFNGYNTNMQYPSFAFLTQNKEVITNFWNQNRVVISIQKSGSKTTNIPINFGCSSDVPPDLDPATFTDGPPIICEIDDTHGAITAFDTTTIGPVANPDVTRIDFYNINGYKYNATATPTDGFIVEKYYGFNKFLPYQKPFWMGRVDENARYIYVAEYTTGNHIYRYIGYTYVCHEADRINLMFHKIPGSFKLSLYYCEQSKCNFNCISTPPPSED